jgi:hypothetical protein
MKGEAMKKPEPSLAPDVTPERALERMKEFTRRLIHVPKSEIPTKRKKATKRRSGRRP